MESKRRKSPKKKKPRRKSAKKKARRKTKSTSGAEAAPEGAEISDQEREKLWAEKLKAWRENPSSIPSVRGSSWGCAKYSHCLADYPGDPSAIVSTPHEAREVAKRKGLIAPFTEVEIHN
jgi:hypothetical protein